MDIESCNHHISHFGFLLIELIITISIMAIIFSIVSPSYTKHIINSRRANVELILLDSSCKMENFYFTNDNSYKEASFEKIGVDVTSLSEYYDFKMAASDQYYEITATPRKNFYVYDEICGPLSINESGVKTAKGRSDPETIKKCW